VKNKGVILLLTILFTALLWGGGYGVLQYYLIPRGWEELQYLAEQREITLTAGKIHYRFPLSLEGENLQGISPLGTIQIPGVRADFSLSTRKGLYKIFPYHKALKHLKTLSLPSGSMVLIHQNNHYDLPLAGRLTNGETPSFSGHWNHLRFRLTPVFLPEETLTLDIKAEGDLPNVKWRDLTLDKGKLSLDLSIPLKADPLVEGRITLNQITTTLPLLSREALMWEDIEVAGKFKLRGKWEEGFTQITTQNLALALGQLKSVGEGTLDLTYPPLLQGKLNLPVTETDTIIQALPEPLLGPLGGIKTKGTFAWRGSLTLPLDEMESFQWTSNPELTDFAVTQIPERVNVYGLNDPFIHSVETPEGKRYLAIPEYKETSMEWMTAVSEHTPAQNQYWRNLVKKQGNKPEVILKSKNTPSVDPDFQYIPLDAMSLYIPKAVLTGEDGDFFFHNGINWLTFRHALERNFRTGEVQLGASTLTMQLIKNLYLTQERTVMRKLQEAFLVYLTEMEALILKERIMEIYLNIVEWGPGIHGIHQASQHFFGKSPEEISLLEAVYLTSILPAPGRYYQMFQQREIPREWYNQMRFILGIMLERDRITPKQYNSALSKQLLFSSQL